MSIGQLPRLWSLSPGAAKEWSDQFAQRLEFLFASPRQIGIVETGQFQATVDTIGFVTIPTPVGDILLQWGTDAIPGASSVKAVTFPAEFPGTAFVAFASGNGTNAFAYSVSALTTTGFTANAGNSGTADSFYWIALGS